MALQAYVAFTCPHPKPGVDEGVAHSLGNKDITALMGLAASSTSSTILFGGRNKSHACTRGASPELHTVAENGKKYSLEVTTFWENFLRESNSLMLIS